MIAQGARRVLIAVTITGLVATMAGALSSVGHAEEQGDTGILSRDERLNAVLWMQTSLEYELACVQSFRLAARMMHEALRDSAWTATPEQGEGFEALPPAIIIDVDETVLDNSAFDARLILREMDHDQDMWTAWAGEVKAEAVPGAREFLNLAATDSVAVFFITNRDSNVEQATVKNLSAVLDHPVQSEQVLCRHERPGWGSDKASRRRYVAGDHRILLLIGDDFNDFARLERVPHGERCVAGRGYDEYWGRKWIILPNPVYGSWERTLYNYDLRLPYEEKLRLKYEALNTAE